MDTTYTIKELSALCDCTTAELNLYLIDSGLIGEVTKDAGRHVVSAATAKKVARHFGASLQPPEEQPRPGRVEPAQKTSRAKKAIPESGGEMQESQSAAARSAAEESKPQSKAQRTDAASHKPQTPSKDKRAQSVEHAQYPVKTPTTTRSSAVQSATQSEDELVNELVKQLEVLRQQLEVKDKQIDALLRQVETLTNASKTLSEACAVNSVTEKMLMVPETQEKKTFWKRLFG